jgi:Flp pilus assembly pilin Flp
MYRLHKLWREEDGQDLIEYTLLIMFIAIATAAVVGSGQNALRDIWGTSNSTIVQAGSAASGASASAS